MAKFQLKPLVGIDGITMRLGAGTGSANNWTDTEQNKAVKLVADSRYDLCAVGDPIEAFVISMEGATADGYTIGTIADDGLFNVTADGLQATPGTGSLSIGDYVVASTIVAKGTACPAGGPKVVKATTQTGLYFLWRVESLGVAGTGAVGTTCVVRRCNS